MVTTSGVAETTESPDVWTQLQWELEDVEISPAIAEEDQEYVVQWIKAAIEPCLMDENDPNEEVPHHYIYHCVLNLRTGGSRLLRSVSQTRSLR